MKIDFIARKFIAAGSLNIHSHNTWEIILVSKGNGTIVTTNQNYSFKKGNVICIPPNITHHNKLETGNIHYTLLTPDFINLPKDSVLVFDDDSAKTIQNIFNVIMAKYYSAEPASNEIISRLGDVLGMIIKDMLHAGYKLSDVEKVKNAMITNFADPDYTIGDAMKNTNYSDAHFRKLFQEEMGMPPIKYLLELRLNSAAMQLKSKANSEISIASIAAESGFNDQGYFARKFKEKYGLTPREYCEKSR